ncbi:uncharacterized protein LOC143219196 [Lasioglossum baleicum]|uniref:uncharacterized protein LOC143219196 n=1 Tax=Lasioglossum baleicum TaxID=434251 RepID=UPI003FCE8638
MDVFSTFNDVQAEIVAMEKHYGPHVQPPSYVEPHRMEERYIEAVITAKKLVSAANCRHRTQMVDLANGNEPESLEDWVSFLGHVKQKFEKKLNETEVSSKSP